MISTKEKHLPKEAGKAWEVFREAETLAWVHAIEYLLKATECTAKVNSYLNCGF